MMNLARSAASSIDAELNALYRELNKIVLNVFGDLKPDVIRCTYHVEIIKGHKYSYKSWYVPAAKRNSVAYLGPAALSDQAYQEFKEKERRFKQLWRQKRKLDKTLSKAVEERMEAI